MTAPEFWRLIERTWEKSGRNQDRKKAVVSNNETTLEELSGFIEEDFLSVYRSELAALDRAALTSYLHLLEELLYRIDRREIHEHTDGSDDGFLYCRCFILAMGEDYYNGIDQRPAKATFDLEAEGFGFAAYRVYEERFAEEFERNSIHSIESGSNAEGW